MRALSCLLLLLLLPACSFFQGDAAGPDAEIRFDGSVAHLPLEGGAWVIEGDDGTTYEPLGLGEDYREEGLRVRVWAEPRDDMRSVLMVGPIIEIRRIERL